MSGREPPAGVGEQGDADGFAAARVHLHRHVVEDHRGGHVAAGDPGLQGDDGAGHEFGHGDGGVADEGGPGWHLDEQRRRVQLAAGGLGDGAERGGGGDALGIDDPVEGGVERVGFGLAGPAVGGPVVGGGFGASGGGGAAGEDTSGEVHAGLHHVRVGGHVQAGPEGGGASEDVPVGPDDDAAAHGGERGALLGQVQQPVVVVAGPRVNLPVDDGFPGQREVGDELPHVRVPILERLLDVGEHLHPHRGRGDLAGDVPGAALGPHGHVLGGDRDLAGGPADVGDRPFPDSFLVAEDD